MKIRNKRYGTITSDQGVKHFEYNIINWRNVFIYAGVMGVVLATLVEWYG